jgi:uncharacterized membrane protein YeaQ/YmgE (transglycosylase-associated protein family)
MKRFFVPAVILAIVLGVVIAWIDSSPNWDDTGISVFMVLVACLLCGYLAGQKPWLIALLVSIWIPLLSIITTQNYGSFMALIPGVIGAYAGHLVRKGFSGS